MLRKKDVQYNELEKQTTTLVKNINEIQKMIGGFKRKINA